MVITLENGTAVSLSEVSRAELRSSLEPVPLTFECEIRLNEEYAPHLLEDKVLKVGKEQTAVKIIHAQDFTAPYNRGENTAFRHIIALHENSAGIAQTLQRAVIRENVSLSEIYRACGGKSEVGKDFAIPRFYAYRGNTPSRLIARVCQEHGGVVRWVSDGNKLEFVRIHDLFGQKPEIIKPFAVDQTVKSGFLVSHELPRYYSTAANGAIIQSQSGTTGAAVFAPLKTQTQLNAMANVILNAKEIPCDFSPDIHAGAVIETNGTKMVVLTAAHVYRTDGSGTESLSVFWLGVKGAAN